LRLLRAELFCAGQILQLDNFRKLTGFGWPGFNAMNLWRQDNGQKACAAAFVKADEQGGVAPIPWDEVAAVSRVAIELSGQVAVMFIKGLGSLSAAAPFEQGRIANGPSGPAWV
jgi:hypothetical protein